MTTYSEIKKRPKDIDNAAVMKRIAYSEDCNDSDKIHLIPLNDIFPNPNQPRKTPNESSILRLADSIRQCGLIHPIIVRPLIDLREGKRTYEILIGERRYKAARLLKIDSIPCKIVASDNKRAAEYAIIENIQREDLNIFDQAASISTLVDIYRLSHEQLAAYLSVDLSFIESKLRLLEFTPDERNLLIKYNFNEQQALSLLRIHEPSLRLYAIELIHKNELDGSSCDFFISYLLHSRNNPDLYCGRRLILKDIGIFYNTIEKAISILKQAGVSVSYEKSSYDNGSTELSIVVSCDNNVSRET